MRHDIPDSLQVWELWHPWSPPLQVTIWASVAKRLLQNPDHRHGEMLAVHFAEKRNLPDPFPFKHFRLRPLCASPAPDAVSLIEAE